MCMYTLMCLPYVFIYLCMHVYISMYLNMYTETLLHLSKRRAVIGWVIDLLSWETIGWSYLIRSAPSMNRFASGTPWQTQYLISLTAWLSWRTDSCKVALDNQMEQSSSHAWLIVVTLDDLCCAALTFCMIWCYLICCSCFAIIVWFYWLFIDLLIIFDPKLEFVKPSTTFSSHQVLYV